MKKRLKNILLNIYIFFIPFLDFLEQCTDLIKSFCADTMATSELVDMLFSFCEMCTGRTLFPYQEQFSKRVIRSILENDSAEITALFARQSGKTETISATVCGLMIILPTLANLPMFAGDKRLEMFIDGFWVGIFAPSQRQAQITFNRIKNFLENPYCEAVRLDPEFNLQFTTSNGQTCALSNSSFATAISASDGSSIEGESFKLIICEECQDISNFKIRKSIAPMGAAYNATTVKIGTATTFKGDFLEAIIRNKTEYASGVSKVPNNFEYNWEVASKYNPRYAKYIETQKRIIGEKSDEFRMAYNLEWILSRGMFLDITEFENRNLEPLMGCVSYDKFSTHVAGIDLGGKGDDTVVTIVEVNWDMPVIMEERVTDDGETVTYMAYNSYVKDWFRIANEPDYDVQYHMIVNYLNNWRLARVYCDATREAGLSHRLQAHLRCEVVPYIFTSKSKSDLYKNLEVEINSGRARVPADEKTRQRQEYKDFIHQLEELQKTYRGSTMVVAHPAEKNAHDDFPDSWALAVMAAHEKGVVDETETRDSRRVFGNRTQTESRFYRNRNAFTAKRR